jgi:acetyl-CoA acetyltransferase
VAGRISRDAAGVVIADFRNVRSWQPATRLHDLLARPAADASEAQREFGQRYQEVTQNCGFDPWAKADTVTVGIERSVVDGRDQSAIAGFVDHDCFTPSEYLAIDHIGLTGPGESWKAIESGDIEIGGRLPINPSGGLIGGGHPVGATGIRMMLDAAKQVSGLAGDYQVDGASRFGTLNIGGSTATTVSFVIGSGEAA